MSMAATLMARLRPSAVPRAAAPMMLASVRVSTGAVKSELLKYSPFRPLTVVGSEGHR